MVFLERFDTNRKPLEILLANEYSFANTPFNIGAVNKIKNLIDSAKSILALTHPSPDEDAIGSLLSILHGFNDTKNVQTMVFSQPNFPTHTLPGGECIGQYDSGKLQEYLAENTPKLIFIVDIGDHKRLPSYNTLVESNIPVVSVDHHLSSGKDEQFLTVNLVDPRFESTTEILFWLFHQLEKPITPQLATSLLLGIFGDTEYYQDISLPERIHLLAYYLKKQGADENTILYNSLRSFSEEELRAVGYALQRIIKKNNYAYVELNFEEYREMAQGLQKPFEKALIARMLCTIKDIDFGFVLLEPEPGKITCSLRARTDRVDLAKVAEQFGGGGHKNSSAFRLEGNFTEVTERLLRYLEALS